MRCLRVLDSWACVVVAQGRIYDQGDSSSGQPPGACVRSRVELELLTIRHFPAPLSPFNLHIIMLTKNQLIEEEQ